jgi:hypothetical protein
VSDQNEPPEGGGPPTPPAPGGGNAFPPRPDIPVPGAIPEPPSETPMPGAIPTPGSLPPPPPGEYRTPAPPRRSLGRRIVPIVILILLLGGGSAIFRAIREATASPKDKAACLATVTMIESDGRTIDQAMQTWAGADDDKIRAEIANVTAAIQARNAQALADSVNRVIKTCNKISSDFRERFKTYCTTHEGACKQNFGF